MTTYIAPIDVTSTAIRHKPKYMSRPESCKTAIRTIFSKVSQTPEGSHTNLPESQNRRQTRTAFRRYGTNTDQAQEGCEGTDCKLKHGDTLYKLRAGMIVEKVIGLILQDGRSCHEQQTTTIQGSSRRGHDLMFRTRRSRDGKISASCQPIINGRCCVRR